MEAPRIAFTLRCVASISYSSSSSESWRDAQASAVLNSVINQSEIYAATQLRQLEGKHDPASERARHLLEEFNISSRDAAVKLVQANDALLAAVAAAGASAGGRKKRRGGKGKKRSGSRVGSKGRRSGSKGRRSGSKGRRSGQGAVVRECKRVE